MSKQFHLYLLPADVEFLVHTLKSRLDVSLIQPWSPHSEIVRLQSATLRDALLLKKASLRVDCYIVHSKGADIRMKFLPGRSRWYVDLASDVIEFSGCEFDGSVLLRGRFYFQNDLLVDDTVVPKRRDFLQWADQVFRLAKRSLRRSKILDAYVGEHAERWRQEGGRFAWTATPERGPIYDPVNEMR